MCRADEDACTSKHQEEPVDYFAQEENPWELRGFQMTASKTAIFTGSNASTSFEWTE